jgi:hypothetical protein
VLFVPFCGYLLVSSLAALFGRSHQQQHVRQPINHAQQRSAGAFELTLGCLFFGGCGSGG